MKFISENNSVKIREKISEKRAVPEMHEDKPLAGPKIFFWASKKLVTGPNGIMVAQTFCDIFFMKKRHHINSFQVNCFFLSITLKS